METISRTNSAFMSDAAVMKNSVPYSSPVLPFPTARTPNATAVERIRPLTILKNVLTVSHLFLFVKSLFAISVYGLLDFSNFGAQLGENIANVGIVVDHDVIDHDIVVIELFLNVLHVLLKCDDPKLLK